MYPGSRGPGDAFDAREVDETDVRPSEDMTVGSSEDSAIPGSPSGEVGEDVESGETGDVSSYSGR